MKDNDEIILDEKSGISIEEQKEILSTIDGIAEKNRQSLSGGIQSMAKDKISAKKSGIVFPVTVNIAAIIALLSGALFIIFFYGRVDAHARTGGVVYDLTERALIEQIRRDTVERITANEIEISRIIASLQEVDAQIFELTSSDEELTPEQRQTLDRLITRQASLREELAVLNDERSKILEESRAREARIRAQLLERARDLTLMQQRTSDELEAAMGELARLSSEQERIASIDGQVLGGLTSVSEHVQNGRYEEARQVIETLRHFNNNNLLSNVRLFQIRKYVYNQTIDSMEVIIDEMIKFQSVNSEGWELYEANVRMQETIEGMQRTIESFSEGSSGQLRRLSELEENISTLRENVTSLESLALERDRIVSFLESERTTLTQNLTDLQLVRSSQEQEIISLREQVDTLRARLE